VSFGGLPGSGRGERDGGGEEGGGGEGRAPKRQLLSSLAVVQVHPSPFKPLFMFFTVSTLSLSLSLSLTLQARVIAPGEALLTDVPQGLEDTAERLLHAGAPSPFYQPSRHVPCLALRIMAIVDTLSRPTFCVFSL
jgi:hypothetical protein